MAGTRRMACVILGAMLVLCLFAAKAQAADYVVGSDAESITVDQAIHPGQTVRLPTFGIYNRGTKDADYQMTVVVVGKDGGLDASWVSFSPSTFALGSGGAKKISASISIPSGTRPGTYRALLAGRIIDPGGSGVKMSVGIGPMLTIHVEDGWWLATVWYRVSGFFHGFAPWSYFGVIVALLAAIAAALTLVNRKSARSAQVARSRCATGSDTDEIAQP
jgi:hypothetical protein